jgi:cytochrome c553
VIPAIKHFIWIIAILGTLAMAEAPSPGRELYVSAGGYGCGICHGPVANGGGQAGGPIRGATREALVKAFAGQPTMQLLGNTLSQDDITELSRYLESLAQVPLVELVYSDQGWSITQESIAEGQFVQMVVFNNSLSDLALNLETFGFAQTSIAPLDTLVLEWIAEAGTYILPDKMPLVVSAE